jgi:hypothetical protein
MEQGDGACVDSGGVGHWSMLSMEAEQRVRGGRRSRASEVVAIIEEEVVCGGQLWGEVEEDEGRM